MLADVNPDTVAAAGEGIVAAGGESLARQTAVMTQATVARPGRHILVNNNGVMVVDGGETAR